MTLEDYNKLPPSLKEQFLQEGGTISSGTSDVLTGIAVEPMEQVVEGVTIIASEEVTGLSSSTQPPLLLQSDTTYKFTEDGQQVVNKRKNSFRTTTGQVKQYDNYNVDYDAIKPNVYAFKDPVELLFFLDEKLQRGKANKGYDLHPWQVQIMVDFAAGINGATPCQDNPFQAVVRACNGSGKDRIVIATCAVWLCMCTTISASAVVTSSSGVQLDNQTCSGIESICEMCNKKIHPKCWKINYRYYECLDTRSPIMCFATDEPGKAEGYHPITFDASFALFESEAKTVPDEIYKAQNKCTGYTHRVIVSTPGLHQGHFYDLDERAVPRSEFNKPEVVKRPIDYVKYHITAYQCSHLSRNYIEQMKEEMGEDSAAFQSQVMAEFGSSEIETVVKYIHLWRLYNSIKDNTVIWKQEPFNKAGVDLARGGDECVFTVRNGNKVLAQVPFSFADTEDTVKFLVIQFNKYNLNSPEALIFIDCGGLGAPIYDRLKGLGWVNCRYVVNQGSAWDKRQYKNRGAEMWWNLSKLIERQEIIIPDEKKLKNQVSGRHYKKVMGDKHQLLDKKEEKTKYNYSPDRADSLVLCYSDYRPSDYTKPAEENLPFKPTDKYKIVGDLTLRSEAFKQKQQVPTTRISPDSFDDLRTEFNQNRNRQVVNN